MTMSVQNIYAAKEIFARMYDGNQMLIYYDEKANYSGVIENWSPSKGTSAMSLSELDQITSVMITNTMSEARPTSMNSWFSNLKNATYISGLEYLHTENVTTMCNLFNYCRKVTSLNVSNFNTANVTDMKSMFNGCFALKTLDVSNFNTAKVTDMHTMFYCCEEITSLDLSGFNTENVTDMGSLVRQCKKLKSINLSSFNTAKVTDMGTMFEFDSELTELDLNHFNVSQVTTMSYMFSNCQKLRTIYCNRTWRIADPAMCEKMFNCCYNLVGGNGTAYNANYTDITYARPDKAGQPGYFTQKGTEAVDQVQGDKVPSTKILRDGQLIIKVGDKTFNALGAEVK